MECLIYTGFISVITLIYSTNAESKIIRLILYICHIIAYVLFIITGVIL